MFSYSFVMLQLTYSYVHPISWERTFVSVDLLYSFYLLYASLWLRWDLVFWGVYAYLVWCSWSVELASVKRSHFLVLLFDFIKQCGYDCIWVYVDMFCTNCHLTYICSELYLCLKCIFQRSKCCEMLPLFRFYMCGMVLVLSVDAYSCYVNVTKLNLLLCLMTLCTWIWRMVCIDLWYNSWCSLWWL